MYGKEDSLDKAISKKKLIKQYSKIINTKDVISDEESPLNAAKRGKESSMWKAIESQKEKKTDISLSAGNTGALLVISRLILNSIDGINKPALAGLWPNNNNMNVVLDLGANIECDEKNLLDFACMGSALFRSLFNNDYPRIALLNIGLEENKGNDVLKKTYSILKKNNVLVLEFNKYGVLDKKEFYDKESMNKMNFAKNITENEIKKENFIYSFLSSVRSKMESKRK